MNQLDILHHRINNQLLAEHSFHTPEQVVEHLLCVQGQDFKQAKRAIASRLGGGISISDIEQAFNEGKIVRTWTQRGTIHVVCAKDVAWMVKLCASKTLKSFDKRKEYLGIDNHQYTDALRGIEEYLGTGPKSRKDIGAHLAQQGITVQSGILYNILCFAGSSGLVVQGPIIDGEHAFALTKVWCKDAIFLDELESLKECSHRYFTSHGPATIEDFMRWSGLNKTQIKKGIELCGEKLRQTIVDGKTYFMGMFESQGGRSDFSLDNISKVHLMAGFDEFLLGYKDRTATLHLDHHTKVDAARNGVFKPTVMIDGETVGIWNVTSTKKKHTITIKAFDIIEKKHHLAIDDAVKEYLQYIDPQLEYKVEYV